MSVADSSNTPRVDMSGNKVYSRAMTHTQTHEKLEIGLLVRVIWNDSPFFGAEGHVRWLSEDRKVMYLHDVGGGTCGFRAADVEIVRPVRRLWAEPSHTP